MSPHVFVEDRELPADHRGDRPCQPPCGLPRGNRVHQLPDVTREQAEHRRRTGEDD